MHKHTSAHTLISYGVTTVAFDKMLNVSMLKALDKFINVQYMFQLQMLVKTNADESLLRTG